MTPKTELFGRIEDYCLELLDAQETREFEKELEFNQDLREEVELHKDIPPIYPLGRCGLL